MLKAQARPVHLYMEANPNPNSLKFVANFMLVEEGVSYDFPDAASAGSSQLAKELFNFAAVQRVFIASNFVTIISTVIIASSTSNPRAIIKAPKEILWRSI